MIWCPATLLRVTRPVSLVLVAVALAGCGSPTPERKADDAAIRNELVRGVGHIRATRDRHELNRQLALSIARLRQLPGSTASARQAKELAVSGFRLTIEGTRYQLAFAENDSGEVAAAARDAALADSFLTRGSNRLRAAGRLLGIRIGTLNQH
jgi:hypothetical protein